MPYVNEPFLQNPPRFAPRHSMFKHNALRRRHRNPVEEYFDSESGTTEERERDTVSPYGRADFDTTWAGKPVMSKTKSKAYKAKKKKAAKLKKEEKMGKMVYGPAKKKAKKKKATTKKVAKRKKSGVVKAGTKAAKAKMAKVRAGKKHATKKVAKKHKAAKHVVSLKALRKKLHGKKRHHVSVLKMGDGNYHTSPFVHRPFKPGVKVNPFGEAAMIVGANPKRRKRHKKAKHNPVRRHSMKRRVRHNPMGDLMGMLPMLGFGIGGAVASRVMPNLVMNLVPSSLVSDATIITWIKRALAVGTAVGGSMVIKQFRNKEEANAFLIGGIASELGRLVSDMVGGVFAGLGFDAFAEHNDIENRMNVVNQLKAAGYGALPENYNGYEALPENYSGDAGMGTIADFAEIDGYEGVEDYEDVEGVDGY